jgi:CheY-like chemotaxis protein
MTGINGPILVVDDDSDIRDMMELVLQMRGYDVVSARDGEDAIEQLQRGPRPSLVLLDLMLPRIDGVEVVRTIKADPRLAPIPVVIISGDTAAREKARQGGADACLLKPIELDELVHTVRGFVPAQLAG